MVNYRTTYNRFVSSAKKRMVEHKIDSKLKLYHFQRKDRMEIHHITPKILGGGNKLKNLVLLSHDEHTYAHFLLNLALFQEGRHERLSQLNYPAFPDKMLEMLNCRKNVLRGLKIEVFISGKHQAPTIMSIREVAKIFCIIRRWNYMDSILFDNMITKIMRAALFFKPVSGIKMKLHM